MQMNVPLLSLASLVRSASSAHGTHKCILLIISLDSSLVFFLISFFGRGVRRLLSFDARDASIDPISTNISLFSSFFFSFYVSRRRCDDQKLLCRTAQQQRQLLFDVLLLSRTHTRTALASCYITRLNAIFCLSFCCVHLVLL